MKSLIKVLFVGFVLNLLVFKPVFAQKMVTGVAGFQDSKLYGICAKETKIGQEDTCESVTFLLKDGLRVQYLVEGQDAGPSTVSSTFITRDLSALVKTECQNFQSRMKHACERQIDSLIGGLDTASTNSPFENRDEFLAFASVIRRVIEKKNTVAAPIQEISQQELNRYLKQYASFSRKLNEYRKSNIDVRDGFILAGGSVITSNQASSPNLKTRISIGNRDKIILDASSRQNIHEVSVHLPSADGAFFPLTLSARFAPFGNRWAAGINSNVSDSDHQTLIILAPFAFGSIHPIQPNIETVTYSGSQLKPNQGPINFTVDPANRGFIKANTPNAYQPYFGLQQRSKIGKHVTFVLDLETGWIWTRYQYESVFNGTRIDDLNPDSPFLESYTQGYFFKLESGVEIHLAKNWMLRLDGALYQQNVTQERNLLVEHDQISGSPPKIALPSQTARTSWPMLNISIGKYLTK